MCVFNVSGLCVRLVWCTFVVHVLFVLLCVGCVHSMHVSLVGCVLGVHVSYVGCTLVVCVLYTHCVRVVFDVCVGFALAAHVCHTCVVYVCCVCCMLVYTMVVRGLCTWLACDVRVLRVYHSWVVRAL